MHRWQRAAWRTLLAAAGWWLLQAGHAAPPAIPPVPNLEALPQPVHGASIDLAAMAERLARENGLATAAKDGPQLLVFVSLSMPLPALRKLAVQAEKCGARLLLRGLKDGSLVQTAAALRDLVGATKAGIQIDPRQFARFNVQQVPTFVLVREVQSGGCEGTSCAAGAFVSLAGDVSLDLALEQVAARASAFSAEATMLLRRIRETP